MSGNTCCYRLSCICGHDALKTCHNLASDGDEAAAQLYRVLESHRQLWATLNPPEFEKIGSQIFGEDPFKSEVLREFHVHQEIYKTVSPQGCPENVAKAAEQLGIQINQDLEVFLIMPKSLHKTRDPKSVRVAVDFHGGGGFTGNPLFPPWMYRAWKSYMIQVGDMISVEPTYGLMPESSAGDILQNVKDLWTWLVTKLEPTVRSLNSNLTVDWGHFSISGVSFGGSMAMSMYREIGRCPMNPPKLHIRGMLLRCPVSQHYHREEGRYMNLKVSKERAERSSLDIVRAKDKLPWVIPRAGTMPPDFMYGAHVCSVSVETPWSSIWKGIPMYEMLEKMEELRDKQTKIRIFHGTEDQHVSLQDSVKLAKMLQGKGLDAVCYPIEGKPHAWDYFDPLTDNLRDFWDSC